MIRVVATVHFPTVFALNFNCVKAIFTEDLIRTVTFLKDIIISGISMNLVICTIFNCDMVCTIAAIQF